MLPLKGFLREELKNAKRLLGEALRFKHRREQSELFYKEISDRLALYSSWLENVPSTDERSLAVLKRLITSQSELLARIERSHVGEFSWVFTENLESLARGIWKNLDPATYPEPLFFICADPELGSYRIYAEQANPTIGHSTPIFSIVYPRTLKAHILFHPILGHELGHPIYQVSPIANEIQDKVFPYLLVNTPLQNDQSLSTLFDSVGITLSSKKLSEIRASWAEELTCDLIGLLLMGPSFVSSHNTILPALGPINGLSNTHPPSSLRLEILRQAIDHLGWLKPTGRISAELSKLLSTFEANAFYDTSKIPSLLSARGPDIPKAITELKNILTTFGGKTYDPPEYEELIVATDKIQNRLPPGETKIEVASAAWNPAVREYDFRDLLFASWLYWYEHGDQVGSLSFYQLSRLCNRSLIQQEALSHWKKG